MRIVAIFRFDADLLTSIINDIIHLRVRGMFSTTLFCNVLLVSIATAAPLAYSAIIVIFLSDLAKSTVQMV